MKKYIDWFLIVLSFVVVISLILKLLDYKGTINKLISEKYILIKENIYLRNSLKNNLNIKISEENDLKNSKIIIYISGKVCSICLEKLVLYLDSMINEDLYKPIILIDDSTNIESIIGLYDAYQFDYDYKIVNPYFEEVKNSIFVLVIGNGGEYSTIEFREEEMLMFEKIFKDLYHFAISLK